MLNLLLLSIILTVAHMCLPQPEALTIRAESQTSSACWVGLKMEVSKNCPTFWESYSKDHNTLESIAGPLIYGTPRWAKASGGEEPMQIARFTKPPWEAKHIRLITTCAAIHF